VKRYIKGALLAQHEALGCKHVVALLTLAFRNIVSNSDRAELFERPDIEMRLFPLSFRSKGVPERLGVDDVGSLGRGREREAEGVELGSNV
jgi:hypothetical protein